MAHTVVQESAPGTWLLPGPWLDIPKNLADEAVSLGFDPSTVLTFDKQESEVLHQARNALRTDPALEHLSLKEAQATLQEFAWRLTLAHAQSKSPSTRNAVVQEFIQQLEAPIRPYSVLYEIEHLRVSQTGVELGPVSFLAVSQAEVDEWYLNERHVAPAPSIGATIAICRVEAGSPKVADRRAGNLVDEALDVLRVSVGGFGFRIWDSQLRFRRKPHFYARCEDETEASYSSMSLADRPHDLELVDGPLADFSRDALDRIGMVWDRRTPQGLRDDLLRSMRWMAKSMAAFSMDDKVVALCTALECLLSNRSPGLKSVDICRRSMTLGEIAGEGFTDPATVTYLYEIRSDVVHGSEFGIGDERHYRTLLRMAVDVLQQVLSLLQKDPTVTSKSKLFAILDDPERLAPCLEWCQRMDPKGYKTLIEDISKRVDRKGAGTEKEA